MKCIFPFLTKDGIAHKACTLHEQAPTNSKPWCSTKVRNETGEAMLGHWGECSQGCPLEEGKVKMNISGQDLPIPRNYIFLNLSFINLLT